MTSLSCNPKDWPIDELKKFSISAGVRIVIRGEGEIINGEFTHWNHADLLKKYKKRSL